MAANTSGLNNLDDTVSIIQFLQRPIKLEHFRLSPSSQTWSALSRVVTTDPQKPVRSYELPYAVLEKGGKMAKTMNHQYFKADIHIKLTLNTNPFVAGRFYLTYSPYENKIVAARQQRWASRAGVTAYPGIEIDAQLDNSVELVIPYASYKEAYVLTAEPENFVTLYLYALTPVIGNKDGKGDIDMTFYAWFENITLNMPTLKNQTGEIANANIQPTIAVVSNVDKERLRLARKIEKMKRSNPNVYEYIMRSVKAANVDLQIQAEAFSTGPIGSIAGTISGIAGAIEGIPIVGEIAGTVGWIADIVGGIAGIWGWSRPNSYTPVNSFQNVPGKFYAHTTAEDQSVSLSLSNQNELDKPVGIFPSDVDEMALAYVCANPAVKDIFDWTMIANNSEDSVSKPIGLIPVGIGCFTAQLTPTGDTVTSIDSVVNANWAMPSFVNVDCEGDYLDRVKQFNFKRLVAAEVFTEDGRRDFGTYQGSACDTKNGMHSRMCAALPAYLEAVGTTNQVILDTAPCEYVSQMFQYWRATLCFKISVVKTAFHTGRLEIFFDPGMYHHMGDDSVTPDLSKYTLADTTNNYKYILDITNDSEVTIRVPYVSERLLLKTQGLNGGYQLSSPEMVAQSIIGSLVIRPVTNLMAPETVNDTIKVVVWKWAEDVVLTGPVNSSNTDFNIYGVTSADEPPQIAFKDIPYDVIRSLKYTPGVVANPEREVTFQINIGNLANGNVVTFFDSSDIEKQNMHACKVASGERIVSLRPLLRAFRDWASFEGNYVLDAQKESHQIDYLSYISYMYRFFRGGMRYKILTNEDSEVSSWIHPGEKQQTTQAPSHRTWSKLNPFHEISVPFYTQYRKLPISVDDNLLNATIKVEPSTTKTKVLRSGNDDLTFGWLMGTPQLMAGPKVVKWISYKKIKDGTIPTGDDFSNLYIHFGPQQKCSSKPTAPSSENNIPNPYAAYSANRNRRDTDGVPVGVDVPDSWGIKNTELQINDIPTPAVRPDNSQIVESLSKIDDVYRLVERLVRQTNHLFEDLEQLLYEAILGLSSSNRTIDNSDAIAILRRILASYVRIEGEFSDEMNAQQVLLEQAKALVKTQ